MTQWHEPAPLDRSSPLPGLHPLVGQTLIRRGLSSTEAARAFLDPGSYTPSPASALPGLSSAVDWIHKAVRAHRKICVWGDFDVDGQTSTTVLYSALQAIGADVIYHIPVRSRESHGVNVEYLEQLIDRSGINLVVTCDTGIGAREAAAYARSRGVDMLITDHHDLPQELPEVAAIVNPKFLPPGHPLATLAGVGVAYKVAEALLAASPSPAAPAVEGLLDLVALGLVADLAILKGDARYLVQGGLKALRSTQRLGLKVMMELAELNADHLTEEHIGFVLGPRLNALGRLSDANPAVELLTTSDPMRARVLATQLEGLNAQRKLLCDQVYQAAESQLRANPALLTQSVLVLAHPAWPAGVVGIVASRLVERYRRPAILLSAPPAEPARGSARSIEGLNITAAIAEQADILLGFGGHPMAAGLSIDPEKLPEFRHRISRTVERLLGKNQPEEAVLEIDGWVELPEATLSLAEQIETLAPFGPGNEKLVLASRGLTLISASPLGRNKEHLKLTVADKNGNQQTILRWDGAADELTETQLAGGAEFDLAYTLRASDWRGVRQAQLEFVAVQLVQKQPVEIKSRSIEVVDCREIENPRERLSSLRLQPSSFVWAEAEHKKQVGGSGRDMFARAAALVIWTTPPSGEELRTALEIVQPEKVFLFAIDPGMDNVPIFLERLAGLIKFTLNQRAGRTSYTELAAATAQKIASIRLGLQWLEKRGQITLHSETTDELILAAGTAPDESAAAGLIPLLRALLTETSAYRGNFRKADAETLINPNH